MLRRFSSLPLVFPSTTTATAVSVYTAAVRTIHFRDSNKTHPLKEQIPTVNRVKSVTSNNDNNNSDSAHNPSKFVTYEYPDHHAIWSEEECRCICNDVRERKTWLDASAYWTVQATRLGFDVISGYKFGKLTRAKILRRALFLETVAGIPGMVAGVLRHLKSLRTMKRDGAWINTLLEEAANERMHMLTFMKLYDPGYLFRFSVLVAQGIFWNVFFIMYLATGGKWCHRFVGHLEESAVYTYTHIIEAMESKDPKDAEIVSFGKSPAPDIAIDYWKLSKDATLLDVVYQIRADEDNHKKVNHCFADLDANHMAPFHDHSYCHKLLEKERLKASLHHQHSTSVAEGKSQKH